MSAAKAWSYDDFSSAGFAAAGIPAVHRRCTVRRRRAIVRRRTGGAGIARRAERNVLQLTIVLPRRACGGRRGARAAAFEPADARVEIDVLLFGAAAHLFDLMAQLFNLALQLLHLRLQCVDLIDQLDVGLRVAAALLLLLELGDALGQAQALRLCLYRQRKKSDGGQKRRREGNFGDV